jgi:hypothetical protein
MGYVDPQQNIRSYVDVMNRKTREIGDNFNLKFNQMNQQMRSNIARNAKKMQEAKLKKELGLESYLDLVQSEGEKIKEGWIDMNDDFLRNELGDQYFNLVGLDDVDSIKKRKNIEKIPSTLAKKFLVHLQNCKAFIGVLEKSLMPQWIFQEDMLVVIIPQHHQEL